MYTQGLDQKDKAAREPAAETAERLAAFQAQLVFAPDDDNRATAQHCRCQQAAQ